jgi:type II secretory pathway pseudopilin PulG
MLVVIAIIGLMASMALPHLGGFTKSNTVAAATQQLLDDVNLARQRAMATRSTVYMVFIPTNFWGSILANDNYNLKNNAVVSNLVTHQAASYAIISLRSVGDQPGRSYPRYLSDWKSLPAGAFIAPYKFYTNAPTNAIVYTTNTLTPPPLNYTVNTNYPFAQIAVPFPSVTVTGGANNVVLPAIGFTANGGLVTYGAIKNDEYIPIDLGTIIYTTAPSGGAAPITQQQTPTIVETPPNNWINNPNLIHISWLTGRAKVERNQF